MWRPCLEIRPSLAIAISKSASTRQNCKSGPITVPVFPRVLTNRVRASPLHHAGCRTMEFQDYAAKETFALFSRLRAGQTGATLQQLQAIREAIDAAAQ